MANHVYGPVPSRRLGRSLGVSLIPAKTCTYSCCYCQLGRTKHQTVERRRHFPPGEILEEVEAALARGKGVDHVTIVGDGEPTISSDLGLVIRGIKELTDVPVAVVTNGSLLSDPQVRAELADADRVLPTLTTRDPRAWQHIHRPHPALDLTSVIEGLIAFSEGYRGDLWLEVMLVQGLNDCDMDLLAIREVIDMVGPDRVDILVPTRPPTESWVKAPDPDRVLRAQEILGTGEALVREADGSFDVSGYGRSEEALMAIGSRHPLTREAADGICQEMGGRDVLVKLTASGELVEVEHRGEVYVLPRGLVRPGPIQDKEG